MCHLFKLREFAGVGNGSGKCLQTFKTPHSPKQVG